MLTRVVAVEYSDKDGRFRGAQIQVIYFEDYSANDWLAGEEGGWLSPVSCRGSCDRRDTSCNPDATGGSDHATELGWDASQIRRQSGRSTNRCSVAHAWIRQKPDDGVLCGSFIREPAMETPTIVVLPDRNDLDDQLFVTFSRCADLLHQSPVQAESRTDLRTRLLVQLGGIVFTTIQKFFPDQKGDDHPLLSDRRNIVAIADEAHRSQYDFIDGYARHMRDALPNASFIGFTGTPTELADANTRGVFGDHISIYDIHRSVNDGATVPIYYESRLARLRLDEREKPNIDTNF